MSTYLRKCIDIAPTAVVTPGPFVANDYRNLRRHTWWPALRETTSWLRLWADWPSHAARSGPAARLRREGAASLGALDAQIDAAHADGMQIILMPYRYPRWSQRHRRHRLRTIPRTTVAAWIASRRLSPYLDLASPGPGPKPDYKNRWSTALPTDGFGPDSRVGGATSSGCGTATPTASRPSRSSTSPTASSGRSGRTVETDDSTARWGTEGTTLVDDARGRRDDGHRRRARPPPPAVRSLLAPSMLGQRRRHRPAAHDDLAHESARASADPFAESLLAQLDAARLRRPTIAGSGLPQLLRRRAQAAPRRLPARRA